MVDGLVRGPVPDRYAQQAGTSPPPMLLVTFLVNLIR